MPPRVRGLLLAVAGATMFSFDGLLVRLQNIPPAGILFWRCLFSVIAFTVMAAVAGKAIQPGADPLRRSWPTIGWLAILSAVATTTFVFSLTHTTVAQTLVIGASVPIATAILGRFALREHLAARTWIAGALALASVLAVVGGSLGSVDLQGDLWALGTVVVSAVLLVLLRRYPNANRLVALAIGSLALAAIAVPWARPLPDLKTALAAAVAGFVTVPGGSLLITLAPRYLRAAEVGLVLLLETVLGPLWVLLVLGEVPAVGVVLSAAIILGAIAVHSWLDLREQVHPENDAPG